MNRKPIIKIDNYRQGGKFRIDFTEENHLNKLEKEGLKFPERKLVKLTYNQQNNQQQQSTMESKQTADNTDINHVAGEFVELTSAESIQEAYNNIHSMEFLIPSPEKTFTNTINISNEVCVQVNNTITTSMDINVLGESTKHNTRNEIQIQNKTEEVQGIQQTAAMAFKCKQCDFQAANSESIISHHIESHMEYM